MTDYAKPPIPIDWKRVSRHLAVAHRIIARAGTVVEERCSPGWVDTRKIPPEHGRYLAALSDVMEALGHVRGIALNYRKKPPAAAV